MRAGRLKRYIAVVEDASGVTYEYVVHAGRRSDAEREVRAAAGQWGTTLVEIKPVEIKPVIDRRRRTRRQWSVVGITIITIAVAAIMIVRETVGGVL